MFENNQCLFKVVNVLHNGLVIRVQITRHISLQEIEMKLAKTRRIFLRLTLGWALRGKATFGSICGENTEKERTG